jgi:3-deoxy-D-manno-octulosonate 8-phosphate phosphatase (KDO 8-P phosphatase)
MKPPGCLGLDDPRFAERAARVRLLGIDFDGVMTDNTVYVFEDGREAVRCSRLEGYGLRRLIAAGAEPVIVSTEANGVVTARARKLNIACIQDVPDKVAAMESPPWKRSCASEGLTGAKRGSSVMT